MKFGFSNAFVHAELPSGSKTSFSNFVIFYKNYVAKSEDLFNFGLWATEPLDPDRPVLPIQCLRVQYLSLCPQSSVSALQVMANSRSCICWQSRGRSGTAAPQTKSYYGFVLSIFIQNYRFFVPAFLLRLWAKKLRFYRRGNWHCLARFLMTFYAAALNPTKAVIEIKSF